MHLQVRRLIDSDTYCTCTCIMKPSTHADGTGHTFTCNAMDQPHAGGTGHTFTCNAMDQPLCTGTVAWCRCEVPSTTSTTEISVFNSSAELCHGNVIRLSQAQPCAGREVPSSSGRCGPIEAHNEVDIWGLREHCNSSGITCTINADHSLEGAVVTCRDMGTMLVIGWVTLHLVSKCTTWCFYKLINPSSSPASPGPPVGLTVSSTSVDQLTVNWTPPTTGGVPTSYNVSINDSSNTRVPIPAHGALQNTFTGLISDTLYTVSVVAINCAGTSSVMSKTRKCRYYIAVVYL